MGLEGLRWPPKLTNHQKADSTGVLQRIVMPVASPYAVVRAADLAWPEATSCRTTHTEGAVRNSVIGKRMPDTTPNLRIRSERGTLWRQIELFETLIRVPPSATPEGEVGPRADHGDQKQKGRKRVWQAAKPSTRAPRPI